MHFELGGGGMVLTLLLKAIPSPTVAALLLIDEKTILQRRPRYSVEFARQAAQGYEELPTRIPGLLVTRSDDFGSVEGLVNRIVASVLADGPADESGGGGRTVRS